MISQTIQFTHFLVEILRFLTEPPSHFFFLNEKWTNPRRLEKIHLIFKDGLSRNEEGFAGGGGIFTHFTLVFDAVWVMMKPRLVLKTSRFWRLKASPRIPSRELTYPTWGKGKSSTQNAIFGGYVSSLEGNDCLFMGLMIFTKNHLANQIHISDH